MIECIFSIDYEIYGNGEGSLKDLVYNPTKKLIKIFDEYAIKLVIFAEVAELIAIENFQSDNYIENVKRQLYDLYSNGHEIALHLHPQWFNAKFANGKWKLDNREYNLCVLPENRIKDIFIQSIDYLREILNASDHIPTSFRAGNWLMQPTSSIAKIISDLGILIDSSVFKGGKISKYSLDYRKASQNCYFWKFSDDVTLSQHNGKLLEIPIYTRLVPIWNILTSKRLKLQSRSNSVVKRTFIDKIYRISDNIRFKVPLKFDFCRMTKVELTDLIEQVLADDKDNPATFKPIVAIGHTKDLTDFETISYFINFLKLNKIKISTFKEIYAKCMLSL
ncbi:MAG: hypothetical protein KQI78_06835 [Deltaproteobacteria bacterium]|nr:hypothetical protein [Deltaproteobacteria bacterium]